LFRDFSPKGLLPGLITLGTASRPAPSLAVIADQYDAVAAHDAQPICSVWRSHGNRIRRVPRSQPVTAVRPNRELFPITGHTSAMGCCILPVFAVVLLSAHDSTGPRTWLFATSRAKAIPLSGHPRRKCGTSFRSGGPPAFLARHPAHSRGYSASPGI